MNEDEEKQKISKYSSGINIILRLDSLWKDTHLHARIGQFEKWDTDLDRIWLELARDLEEKKYEKKKIKIKVFDDKIKELGGYYDKEPDSFEDIKKDVITKRAEVYKNLNDKQVFLARLENTLGKGTTEEDDDDDDMD